MLQPSFLVCSEDLPQHVVIIMGVYIVFMHLMQYYLFYVSRKKEYVISMCDTYYDLFWEF
jgi:hypothetical protein